MTYVRSEYSFDKHPPHNLYPHKVTLRVVWETDPDVETIKTVIAGHNLLLNRVAEARKWLESNILNWQPENVSSSVFRFCFAKKSDAMLFRVAQG
ncbi:hypothetical protein D3C72_1770790 [compost metagenome]